MLRQALLIGFAACGLSACSWGYNGVYGAGYSYPYGYPAPTSYAYGYGTGPVYQGAQWAAPRPVAEPLAPRQPHTGELSGPGVETLDEWLRDTTEGRAIVTLGFHDAAEGVISEDVAQRANIWFRHYADNNRDMTITDEEIRTALVSAAGRYVRTPGA